MKKERIGEWTANTPSPDEVAKIIAAGGSDLIKNSNTTIMTHTGQAAGLARQLRLESIAESCGVEIEEV